MDRLNQPAERNSSSLSYIHCKQIRNKILGVSAAYFFFPGRRSPVEEEEGKSIKRLFRLPGIYREVQRHIYLFITNTSSLFFFFLLYFYLLLLFFLLCFIFRLVVIIRSLEKIEKTKTFFGATFESRKRAYHRNLIFTVYLYIQPASHIHNSTWPSCPIAWVVFRPDRVLLR